MFGLGNDSDKKLEQNMEQIKQLVEEEEQPDQQVGDEWQQAVEAEQVQQQPVQNEEAAPGQDLEEELQNFEQSLEKTEEQPKDPQQTEDFSESTGGSEANDWESGTRGWQRVEHESQETQKAEEGAGQEDPVSSAERNQSPQELEERRQADRSAEREPVERQQRSERAVERERAGRTSERLSERIPEPAKTRKLEVPEVDKGPLFIRQKKFERAAQLIRDMQYLTEQIEATVNAVEEDIQRSQETESEILQLVDDFETGRTEVEDIVSPDDS